MERFLEIAPQIFDPSTWPGQLLLWSAFAIAVAITFGKVTAVYYEFRLRYKRLEERKIELEIALLKQKLEVADPQHELIDQPLELSESSREWRPQRELEREQKSIFVEPLTFIIMFLVLVIYTSGAMAVAVIMILSLDPHFDEVKDPTAGTWAVWVGFPLYVFLIVATMNFWVDRGADYIRKRLSNLFRR